MNFLDYIKGRRKGIEAHRIERDSMNDPFMYEAIEGFDSITDDHAKQIGNIQKQLAGKARPARKHISLWQTVAACAVVIFAAGAYFFFDYDSRTTNNLYAQAEDFKSEFIEIYIPDNYYSENIVTIAKHNTEIAKAHRPAIQKSKTGKQDNIGSEPTDEDTSVIEIYIPKE